MKQGKETENDGGSPHPTPAFLDNVHLSFFFFFR